MHHRATSQPQTPGRARRVAVLGAAVALGASTLAGCSLFSKGDDYCTLARQIAAGEAALADGQLDLRDREQVQARMTELADLYRRAAVVAPAEISADANTLSQGVNRFVDAFAQADWDVLNLFDSQAVVAIRQEPEYRNADARVAAVNAQTCGITPTTLPAGETTATTGGEAGATTTTRSGSGGTTATSGETGTTTTTRSGSATTTTTR